MKTKRANTYEVITDKIIELLESGVVPWKKGWLDLEGCRNFKSKKGYRGINIWVLSGECMLKGYSDNLWLTFKQAKDMGGNVKKGEKSCPVVYWLWLEVEDKKTGKKKKVPFPKHYRVFNIDQCEGVEYQVPEIPLTDFSPIEKAEKIIDGYKTMPKLKHEGCRAFYKPSMDYICMPKREHFLSEEDYYNVLFHEMTHSTGHETRLDRKAGMECVAFGSESYSKEELVAEMGSAFLCSYSRIESKIENSAAYIQSWLNALKDDKKLLVQAASQAQKAADYILGREQITN